MLPLLSGIYRDCHVCAQICNVLILSGTSARLLIATAPQQFCLLKLIPPQALSSHRCGHIHQASMLQVLCPISSQMYHILGGHQQSLQQRRLQMQAPTKLNLHHQMTFQTTPRLCCTRGATCKPLGCWCASRSSNWWALLPWPSLSTPS